MIYKKDLTWKFQFSLFRDLVESIAWDTAPEGFVQESWLTFKDHLLQAQEQSFLTSTKPSKDGMVGFRKAKALLKWNLLKDMKVNKKGNL